MSLLASLAINSVSMAFAVSESDITVIGNENTWTSTTNGVVTNIIDTNTVFIKIKSEVGVSNFECQLQTMDGSTVSNFEDCKDDDTHGSKSYQDLNNGPYKFNVRITPNGTFNGNQFTLSYVFATNGAAAGTAEPGVSAGENITGSINFISAIVKAIASQMKISLNDASTAAEKSIGNNSHAVSAHVGDENGYLIYDVAVVDSNGKVHKLIIDPSNGKTLLSRELSGFEALMMFHQGMQSASHDKSVTNSDFNYGN